MKKKLLYYAFPLVLVGLFLLSSGQQVFKRNLGNDLKDGIKMDIEKLKHPVVKEAILALQAGDSKSWFALFTTDAQLFDDGSKMNFRKFFEKALGHERFRSIDKVEDHDLSVYGKFHSDLWGDFKTYFKFQINESGKISRLDIGQAKY